MTLDTYLQNPQEFEVLLNHVLSFSSRQELAKNAFHEVGGLKPPIQLLSGRTLSNDLGALPSGVFVKLERSS